MKSSSWFKSRKAADSCSSEHDDDDETVEENKIDSFSDLLNSIGVTAEDNLVVVAEAKKKLKKDVIKTTRSFLEREEPQTINTAGTAYTAKEQMV